MLIVLNRSYRVAGKFHTLPVAERPLHFHSCKQVAKSTPTTPPPSMLMSSIKLPRSLHSSLYILNLLVPVVCMGKRCALGKSLCLMQSTIISKLTYIGRLNIFDDDGIIINLLNTICIYINLEVPNFFKCIGA